MLDTPQGQAPHAILLFPTHNRVANRIQWAIHSLYCLKHMRPVLDTTVDEASIMGATTSNHTIETIPQGDKTIFVVVMGPGLRLTHLARDSLPVQVCAGHLQGCDPLARKHVHPM